MTTDDQTDVHIQTNSDPASNSAAFGYRNWRWPESPVLQAGPNDGGIKRGDREDTGDDQAAPDELGTGIAEGTVDSTSLGGGTSISSVPASEFDSEEEISSYDGGMEVMQANDGRLGLTGLPDSPADDWAADTGETRNPND